MKKATAITLFPLICVSFLLSQNLVELAEKEKERRAKLEEKSTKVVTNADLAKGKRLPALTVTRAYIPLIQSPALSPRPADRAAPGRDRESTANLQQLEAQAKKDDEYVELLTLKMNGLWQKFYSFRDWTLRDEIQRDMAETYQKLQKAKQAAEKTKREIERQKSRKRR
jgi:hypothetical protein